MVHVLPCHQFAGDPKTLALSQDPLTIFASRSQLFVATLQHSVNVYGLGDGSSGDHGSLQHSFTTAGLVKQGAYSTTGNYIATLEVQGSPQHQTTSIRVYFNWEMSGPHLAVRARVAGGDIRERGATVSTYNLDRRSGTQFELVEVQTPAPAQCISCCPATGNLAAGIDNTVSVYRFVVQNPGTPTECGDFDWLIQLRMGLMVREVRMCEGTIACMGTQELQVVKVRLWDTASREPLRGRSVTDTEIIKTQRGKRRVPLLIKPAPSPEHSGSDEDSEAPASSWKSPADLKKGKSREFCQAQPYFVIAEGAALDWDFGIEATSGVGADKSSSTQQTTPGNATVYLPSIQSEEPYYESSEVNCEMIGPVSRFEGHPTHILLPKRRTRKLRTSLTQLLYRRFIMSNINEGDNDNGLHSLQFLPTYATASHGKTEPSNDLLESSNAQNLAGLCCFFSTSRGGYLYEMQPRPRLLTEYTYKADALQVEAGRSLLYALTQNGLETFTLRTAAAALPNMEAVDNIANTCPPATLDISLVGLEPYLGLTQLTVSQKHVMLLSKTKESSSQAILTRGEMSASISSKASTVYILEQACLSTIYKSLVELGERYRHTSPGGYLQSLLEGHLLLRMAKMNRQQENAQAGLEDFPSSKSPDELQSLYLQSCLQLALHYCRGETSDWHLTLPYFNMSELPLQKIIQLCPKPYTAFEDEEIVSGAGSGMIHYLDWALFDENSTVEVDQETADSILKYFVSLAPQHCSKVVLFSKISSLVSPDNALTILTKVKDTHQPGQHVNFAGIPGRYAWGNLDRLALSEVYLRLGDLEQAATTLCTLSTEEITQLCTQHSSLLLQGDDQFSHLAQLIRQQEPESLLSALVQLIDENTVALHTCIKLLRDENESLTSLANSHLKRFLEEVVSSNHRHGVLPGAAELLLEIYFERLKKGMSKGAPLRQSSRHTHIFFGLGGGCFHKTPEWMDYLPPFQGPESLTFKCLQAVSPSNPRPARGFMGRLQTPILGKFGGGQRPNAPGQSQQGRPAGADGKGEEEIVCPCCCCNDDLLNIQSLITSPCASPALASRVMGLIKAAAVTTPSTTTPTHATPAPAMPTPGAFSPAMPTSAAPTPAAPTQATPTDAKPITPATPTSATPTTLTFSQSLQSLDTVCRSVLDPQAILQLLIKEHPGIVLDYAQDTFGKDTQKWKELLKMLLDRGAEMSLAPEVGGDRGRDGGGEASSSNQADYLQILTGVLGHVSNLLAPEELLRCLPSEGSLSFFLPYLRQSCCQQNAQVLHQRLIKMLAT
ncbi:uncharacterized protein LOC119744921 [Patiria miniata]|uniref:Uncharacterized protein n=1 Tax=Patiria miniata TaxID=46514 RepID=A0A914BMT5_PATMI|nr:uncharacterized protein LOC119744921 [Patiria miniata]XP_038077051.1 uncharacterized protein LOC119744921 [Patiria miniata]